MSRSPLEVGTVAADERASGVAAGDDASSVVAGEGAPGVAADEAACANCGERLAGDYCHRCGEKRPEARDLSVRHFLAFVSLTTVLMWPIYFVIGIKPTTFNLLIAAGKFALDIAYLFFALRAFYREPPLKAILRAPVIFAGYFITYVFIYIASLAVTLFSL